MNPSDVTRHRLARQDLLTARFTRPSDLVRALGAVQAQDYPGARWAIGQRLVSGTDALLERAMSEGSIIRTHVLRPTWHFVTPADLRWMLALTGPRVMRAMASYDRKLSLDAAVYRRSAKILQRALEGGRHLTRQELAAELKRGGLDPGGTQRLSHLMLRAELDALVCSGPVRGKQFTYALVDERVPPTPPLGREEALFELTKRYFATRAPATAPDFAWWSGLTAADAREGIALLGERLTETSIDGVRYWLPAERPRVRMPRLHALLLPNYDEYFIGFKDRGAIGQRLRTSKQARPADAFFAHVIVVNGQIVGDWKREFGKDTVTVRPRLFVPLTKAERQAMTAAAERYAAFLGRRLEIS